MATYVQEITITRRLESDDSKGRVFSELLGLAKQFEVFPEFEVTAIDVFKMVVDKDGIEHHSYD